MIDGVLPRLPLFLASLAGLCACRGDAGYQQLSIHDPWGRWEREGFVRLETPVHAPSSSEGLDQVEIWIKVPEGGVIAGREGPHGPTLAFPPGSELDRVEYAGHDDLRQVIDVRGTRIDPSGNQHFHVFRKEAAGRSAPMFGLEWPRDDAKATAAATDAFIARLEQLPPGKDYGPKRRSKYLGSLRAKNDCAGCHLLDRAPNHVQGEHGLVNRGTDADGFFTPLAVLSDEAPVEAYGLHDLNVPDPHVTVSCGARSVDVAESGKPSCPDAVVPVGRIELSAALAANDPRALAVCDSRRYLFERLDETGRRLFASSVAACPPAP